MSASAYDIWKLPADERLAAYIDRYKDLDENTGNRTPAERDEMAAIADAIVPELLKQVEQFAAYRTATVEGIDLDGLSAQHASITAGRRWYTVESPWRDPSIPTYATEGDEDPHAGTPVLDSIEVTEWDEDQSYEHLVNESDARLTLAVDAVNALPALVTLVRKLAADVGVLREALAMVKGNKACGSNTCEMVANAALERTKP